MSVIDSEISSGFGGSRGSRIAVLLEPGRRGAAALEHAAGLGAKPTSEVTIVALAPRVETVCRSCGGVSARAYNCAVRDEVAEQLQAALAGLAVASERLRGKVLVEGIDPSLEQWVTQEGFDLVLLPARHSLPHTRRHPTAGLLRRCTDATVQVVTAGAGSSANL
jgi:hypothetical protein